MPKLIFVTPDGQEHPVEAPIGLTVLEVAHKYGFNLEGACDGSLACSTCHVILEAEWFDRLGKPSSEEEDMLDLAWGVTRTSRLGCQIAITQALDGLKVRIPDHATNNLL